MTETIINNKNNYINVLKTKYTNELNTVNYYYWPIVARSKKKLANLKWYFTLSLCLVASVIILLLLYEITNSYWIGISLGVSLAIAGLITFFLIKRAKKHKAIYKEWDKALKPANDMKKELDEKESEAIKLMLDFLNQENKMIDNNEDIGSTYDDILYYFNTRVGS